MCIGYRIYHVSNLLVLLPVCNAVGLYVCDEDMFGQLLIGEHASSEGDSQTTIAISVAIVS